MQILLVLGPCTSTQGPPSSKSHGRDVRVTSVNSKLISCGGDRQVFYWAVATGRVIWKFRGHDSEVNAVSSIYMNTHLRVSAGYDQSLRAWDCRSHSTEPIQVIDAFTESVMSVCLTKTDIIGGTIDATIRTFDIHIVREICYNLGQPVNCISMSNDGNCILSMLFGFYLASWTRCFQYGVLFLTDLSSQDMGELLQESKGQTCDSYKLDCCLTNADAHVAGGYDNDYIYFWDLVNAPMLARFRAHSSVVTSELPPQGCMITASVNSTISGLEDLKWRKKTNELLAVLISYLFLVRLKDFPGTSLRGY